MRVTADKGVWGRARHTLAAGTTHWCTSWTRPKFCCSAIAFMNLKFSSSICKRPQSQHKANILPAIYLHTSCILSVVIGGGFEAAAMAFALAPGSYATTCLPRQKSQKLAHDLFLRPTNALK
jgi:hypothetical protein